MNRKQSQKEPKLRCNQSKVMHIIYAYNTEELLPSPAVQGTWSMATEITKSGRRGCEVKVEHRKGMLQLEKCCYH